MRCRGGSLAMPGQPAGPHADQVERRERYQRDHPDVAIAEAGGLWTARAPGRDPLVRVDLRRLLNALESR